MGGRKQTSASYPEIAKCREEKELTYTSEAKMAKEENGVVEAEEKNELEDLNEPEEEVIQVTS